MRKQRSSLSKPRQSHGNKKWTEKVNKLKKTDSEKSRNVFYYCWEIETESERERVRERKIERDGE